MYTVNWRAMLIHEAAGTDTLSIACFAPFVLALYLSEFFFSVSPSSPNHGWTMLSGFATTENI